MLINLSDVLSEQHKTVDETAVLDLDFIEINLGKFPIISKEPVHVVVRHIEGRQLEIDAQTKVTIIIPCDRCLEDVQTEFDLDFQKHVDLSITDAELPEGFDESDYIEGYHLDVDKLIFNEILIGWPTKVLCRENCKGICNVCGQNLNKGTCNCEDTSLDPRMSVVRDLFKNFKEV